MTRVVTNEHGEKHVVVAPTPAQVTDMIHQIKLNTLQVSDIPVILHPHLFTQLQIAKNEAQISRQQDLYDHLSDAIWSLKLTPNMPEPDVYRADAVRLRPGESLGLSQTAYAHSIPLVAAYRETADAASILRRLEADLIAVQRFWEAEERRLWEIHSAKLQRLTAAQAAVELPDDPLEHEFAVNEQDAEVLAVQQVWLVKAGAMEAKKNGEIAEIKRRIAELSGRRRSARNVPIARIGLRGRRTQKWKLFSGSDARRDKGEQRLIAVAEPSDPGGAPAPRDCLLSTGVNLSGTGRAPRPRRRIPAMKNGPEA
jgi:hypothetical protein